MKLMVISSRFGKYPINRKLEVFSFLIKYLLRERYSFAKAYIKQQIVLNLLANLAVKNIFSITKNYCFMKGIRILYAG